MSEGGGRKERTQDCPGRKWRENLSRRGGHAADTEPFRGAFRMGHLHFFLLEGGVTDFVYLVREDYDETTETKLFRLNA